MKNICINKKIITANGIKSKERINPYRLREIYFYSVWLECLKFAFYVYVLLSAFTYLNSILTFYKHEYTLYYVKI